MVLKHGIPSHDAFSDLFNALDPGGLRKVLLRLPEDWSAVLDDDVIFGMGRIGREIAKRAGAFDMEIGYHNRRPLEPAAGLFFADERAFLARTDILVIAAPASPETRRWLNAERIARLPEGALVVNIARGSLVDDGALIAAVESGRLAGAGLDVFEGEPDIHPPYLRADRIYVQPHIGSSTMETRLAMAEHAISGPEALFAGRDPPNRLV